MATDRSDELAAAQEANVRLRAEVAASLRGLASASAPSASAPAAAFAGSALLPAELPSAQREIVALRAQLGEMARTMQLGATYLGEGARRAAEAAVLGQVTSAADEAALLLLLAMQGEALRDEPPTGEGPEEIAGTERNGSGGDKVPWLESVEVDELINRALKAELANLLQAHLATDLPEPGLEPGPEPAPEPAPEPEPEPEPEPARAQVAGQQQIQPGQASASQPTPEPAPAPDWDTGPTSAAVRAAGTATLQKLNDVSTAHGSRRGGGGRKKHSSERPPDDERGHPAVPSRGRGGGGGAQAAGAAAAETAAAETALARRVASIESKLDRTLTQVSRCCIESPCVPWPGHTQYE
eukprot:COSAG01_NODE_337_length_18678_cov_21.905969_3_plen_355_part_00